MRILKGMRPAAAVGLLFACLIAVLAPAILSAQSERPAAEELSESAIPPLQGGLPGDAPATAAERPAANRPAAGNAPVIDVWYGLNQTAGQRGDPQKWFNVLGNVTSAVPVVTLSYSLNGGPSRPLSIGPDNMRLARPGDFNIELDYTDLRPGGNTIAIVALDEGGGRTQRDVNVDYQGGAVVWQPGTYQYDWATADHVGELAQVVDGHWVLDGNGVRPTVFDFDRLLALGDLSWRDYTVTVPITVYAVDEAGYQAPSNGPGVGVMVRWQGHYDAENGVTPVTGWRRLGALGWYRWRRQGDTIFQGFQLLGHGGRDLGEGTDQLELGTTYIFKLSVRSNLDPAIPAGYRFKVWPAAESEPVAWDVERRGIQGEPSGGGLLLLAHHVDARFGVVRVDLEAVRPQPTVTILTGGDGAGGVKILPADPIRFGEDVTLTAAPALGSLFGGWAGAVEGTQNPATLTLFESQTVTATFNIGGGGLLLPVVLGD